MLLRILIAGFLVFGAFAIAGWVVSPGDFGGGSIASKGDRQVPGAATTEPDRLDRLDRLEPPEPAAGAKRVRTTIIRPPGEDRIETALLNPQATPVPSPPTPASAPTPPAAKEERRDPRKPFRCPRGTAEAAGPPTIAQIARIGTALRLSPDQEKHWRPVERALLEIAKHFEGPDAADARRAKALLSVERMQQIYWMAGPLVISLREEQKREARQLACTMGLAAVAALI
jgi:hypothetical protein